MVGTRQSPFILPHCKGFAHVWNTVDKIIEFELSESDWETCLYHPCPYQTQNTRRVNKTNLAVTTQDYTFQSHPSCVNQTHGWDPDNSRDYHRNNTGTEWLICADVICPHRYRTLGNAFQGKEPCTFDRHEVAAKIAKAQQAAAQQKEIEDHKREERLRAQRELELTHQRQQEAAQRAWEADIALPRSPAETTRSQSITQVLTPPPTTLQVPVLQQTPASPTQARPQTRSQTSQGQQVTTTTPSATPGPSHSTQAATQTGTLTQATQIQQPQARMAQNVTQTNMEAIKRFDPGKFYGYRIGDANEYMMKCKLWLPKVGITSR